ncbi:MAG: DUF3857 domain-containing protein [Bergeyella sp.]
MKTKLLFMLLISAMSFAQHKFVNVPKLTDEDIASTQCASDAEATAEVLYRSYHYRIDYNGYMYVNVTDRVKIYKKDNAGDYLNHEILTYDNGRGSREILNDVKAFTYNMENGKRTETKVTGDSKYKSKEDKNYTVTKFAFPNVKDGSVVQYEYDIMRPFLSSTPRVFIEDKIPVRYVEYVFETPKVLGYNINFKGSIAPKHRDVGEKNIYGGEYQVYRFAYENVPAYKDEEFVQNNDNYRTAFKAELNSSFIGNELKKYALTWNDIRKRLYEHDDFGQQLNRKGLVKDLLPAEIKSITSKKERAEAVLKFVQKNYTFNKDYDVVTDKGIRNLINTKIGNAAEINLLLVMLLKEAEIDANPVVLSTVGRGLLLSYTPSIEQLNFVVASFEDAKQIYLLDGTKKRTKINMIDPRALNHNGILMNEKEAVEINIVYPGVSETYLVVDAKMNPDGTFEGHFSDRDTDLYSIMVEEKYNEDKTEFEKTYKEKYKFPFSNIKSGLQENGDFETAFDFTSDTFVDAIGNKLVFNPLLFLYSQNHSFNQAQERKSPLEFVTRNKKIKKVTITLPDNYVFENVPKSKKFRTDDNSIQYAYVVTQNGNTLTVETTVTIDDSFFPKEYYPAFKQIYDNITKMEGQVVTAVKK